MRLLISVALGLTLLGIAYFYLQPRTFGPEFEVLGSEEGVGNLPRRIRHVPTGIVLVLIPPGRFVMGTPQDEYQRDGDEPQHEVRIADAFYMADTEVTVALWKSVMGEGSLTDSTDDDLPMTGVSWHRAMEFVGRMNSQGKGGWGLPTEHQWEYACRAGTTTVFSFGDTLTTDQANYRGDYPYANSPSGLNRARPVPVRSLPPNPWGLYEMHGNAYEWCADLYTVDPQAKKHTADPGAARVIRGGSYESQANLLRCGHRDGYPPNSSGPKYGLRLTVTTP